MKVLEVEATVSLVLDDFDTDDPHEAVDLLKFQLEQEFEFCALNLYVRDYGVIEEYDDYDDYEEE